LAERVRGDKVAKKCLRVKQKSNKAGSGECESMIEKD